MTGHGHSVRDCINGDPSSEEARPVARKTNDKNARPGNGRSVIESVREKAPLGKPGQNLAREAPGLEMGDL